MSPDINSSLGDRRSARDQQLNWQNQQNQLMEIAEQQMALWQTCFNIGLQTCLSTLDALAARQQQGRQNQPQQGDSYQGSLYGGRTGTGNL